LFQLWLCRKSRYWALIIHQQYSSRLLAQASRFLGKENIDSTVIDRLRRIVPAEGRANFRKDARYSTDWILIVAQQIYREQPDE
jgi:hypothetical protein